MASFFGSSSKGAPMPPNSGPSISFDLIKTNKAGKRQQRKLNLSSAGVSNMAGSQVRWFVPNVDIHSVIPDPTDTTNRKFVLITKNYYHFEAESDEQEKRIFEAFKMMGLGDKYAMQAAEEVADDPEEVADSPKSAGGASGWEKKHNKQAKGPRMQVTDYELLTVIGKGSFGKVMQVRKKDDQKIYAMKVLIKSELVKRQQVDHTKTEKAILTSIEHPFLVRCYYAFQNYEKLYMVLDYVNGGELFYHLRKAGRFPEELARFYIAEVVLAISYLHSRDIIYRDLKPENILLDSQGHLMITDFGLSKEEITSVGGKGDGTTTKTFCGTPEYLAPEIITGIGHGKAVDWWSVGILLYEMLTGQPPFYSANRNEMYLNAIKGDLVFPSYISEDSRAVVSALLIRRPEERLGSGPSGAQDVQAHKFFRSIDWDGLRARKVPPPFKPRVKDGQLDISNFDAMFTDEVPADDDVEHDQYTEEAAGLFEGFEFSPPPAAPSRPSSGKKHKKSRSRSSSKMPKKK